MTSVSRRERAGWDRWGACAVIWAGLAAVVWLAACDRDAGESVGEGESRHFEIAGLRAVIERHGVGGSDRILVAGRSGRDLHARLLWAGADGTVYQDVELPTLERPTDVTACISGHDADIYWVTTTEDQSQLYISRVRGDAVEGGPAPPPLVLTSAHGWTLGRVVGLEEGCGVCLFDPSVGELSCQLGLHPNEPRAWHTGPLGEWTVLSLGERLVLADWAADDEGWITVRITPLGDTQPADAGWLHSYVIAQLPNIADPAERPFAHPSFLPAGDDVHVVFVDGTDWFTRLFVQRFQMDQVLPDTPDLVESCRGTCKIRWVERFDGFGWVWFVDEQGDVALRLSDDGTHVRRRFEPPPHVEPLDHGWFKMGLGNDVANWWALVTYEPS